MEVYHLRGRLSDARGGKTGYTPAAFAERKTLAYHPAHETLLASNRDHLYFCARANLVKGVFGDDFGQQEHRGRTALGERVFVAAESVTSSVLA